MTLIGLIGYALSGKTSIANAVAAKLGLPVESFAAPLKTMADLVCVPGSTKIQRREVLVAVGRHHRQHNPTHWIDSLVARLTPLGGIIDDCRYRNEVARLLDMGGIVFHVRREGVYPANAEEATSLAEIHADSELTNRMHFLHNDGTIDDAAQEVLRVVGRGVAVCAGGAS